MSIFTQMFTVLAGFFLFPYALCLMSYALYSVATSIKKKFNLQGSVASIVITLKDRLAYDSLYNLFDVVDAHTGRIDDIESSKENLE